MADEYIKCDEFLSALLNLPCKMDGQGYEWLSRRSVWNMALAIPAADVRPVVRGRWMPEYPVTHACSNCGFVAGDYKLSIFKFCPNCGADMREVQNG